MANDDTAPSDTTIMDIVHDALRQNLDRLHPVLTTDMVNSSDDAKWEAIAAHVEWRRYFLLHQGEDWTTDGLDPDRYQVRLPLIGAPSARRLRRCVLAAPPTARDLTARRQWQQEGDGRLRRRVAPAVRRAGALPQPTDGGVGVGQ